MKKVKHRKVKMLKKKKLSLNIWDKCKKYKTQILVCVNFKQMKKYKNIK